MARLAAAPAARVGRPLGPAVRQGLLRSAGLLVALGLWQVLSSVGVLHPTFVPPPSAVVGRALALPFEAVEDFSTTLFEIGIAFVVSSCLGVALGVLLGLNRPLNALVGPLLWFLYASPLVAFVTLFVVTLGIGPSVPIALGILGSVVILIASTREGVRQIDANLVKVGRVFGANELTLVQKIVVPAAIPMMLSGLRIGTGRMLVGVIVGEFFASANGLGYLIVKYGYAIDMKGVYGTVIWIVLVGIALNALFSRLERHYAPGQAG